MLTAAFITLTGFIAQLVDGGLGMGFGVTSSTMLITFVGLAPASASAVVHAAQIGTAAASGLSHLRFGNVDTTILLRLGIPGAIGSFSGAMVLSSLSAEAARPITSTILASIGAFLLVRTYYRRTRPANLHPKARSYPRGSLPLIGVFGGFIAASGGGGWGPVSTSSLMALGRTEPRRVIGTVCAAEFLVSLSATAGFIFGLSDQLRDNAVVLLALLCGGALAAPVAAYIISRIRPGLLGGLIGVLLILLNLPGILQLFGA